MTQETQQRILRIQEVSHLVGLSRASLYRLMRLGLFPKSIKLGLSAVGWDSNDLVRWISSRKPNPSSMH
ncbi:MAG: AlpA family phage regulatory protein [Betaproteobacteria bacterium]|nr:AlpA family phage regulatory protein [Betaproteobacteria bacterium]MDE2621916.1 AlpA family phage regulatory protein [Betaproteobacteria bacterium]